MRGLSYWLFPVISSCCWQGMLLGLLISWTSVGKPHYPSMDSGQHIAYISDVGAGKLKPLFIVGSCVTTIFLDLSFLSERWLRHSGHLARNTSSAQKVLACLSIFFATIGTAGLILLSIFDTIRYPRLHDIFLLLFIAGYLISAIFTCWEYQRLGIHHPQHRILRVSFWIKLAFIVVEVINTVAFGANILKKHHDVAAELEWAIAFIFTFYVFSFYIDLLPAVKTKNQAGLSNDVPCEQTEMQQEIDQDPGWQNTNRNTDRTRKGNSRESQLSLDGNDMLSPNDKSKNQTPVSVVTGRLNYF